MNFTTPNPRHFMNRNGRLICGVFSVMAGGALVVFVIRGSHVGDVEPSDGKEQISSSASNNQSQDPISRASGKQGGGKVTPPQVDCDRNKLLFLLTTNSSPSSYNDLEIVSLMLKEARSDPQWAFDALLQSRNLRVHGYFESVLKEIYESDPRLFFQRISNLDSKTRIRVQSKFLGGVCAILAEHINDQGNVSAIERIYSSFKNIDNEYIQKIADEDPAGALKLVNDINVPQGVKSSLKGAIASALALSDRLPEAVDLLKEEIGGGKLEKSYNTALYQVISKDPSQISGLINLASVSILNQFAATPELVDLISEKGSTEDKKKLLGSLTLTDSNKAAYGVLIASVFASSAQEGLAQINSLPNSAARSQILDKCFTQIASMEPDKARQLLAQVGQSDVPVATRAIAKSLAKVDWDSSLEFAAQTSDALKPDVYREIGRTSALESPLQAVKFLEDPRLSLIVGEDFRGQMLDHTVRSWVNQDMEKARTWVENLPATDLPMGVQGLMNPWMKSDPVAASEWLSALPPGAARDAGARVVIEQVKNTDPEMAEQWRKSLSQPTGGQDPQ